VRALAGGIPRALRSHRSAEGALYGAYTRAILARLGELPHDAKPTLKAAGMVVLELERLGADLERARTRQRRRDQNRIRRQMVILRTQLLTLEKRLEEIAERQPRDWTEVLAGGRRG
jgi:hypothetical protein